MLVVEGLTCRFGSKAAVDNATFSIAPGGFVGVIGRSGAGKSTLLRMINRLAEPTSGRILFDGVDVTALRGRELRKWRARSAMIFQQFNLIGRLDVLTNVLMGRLATVSSARALLKLWPDTDKAVALAALEQFEIASLAVQRADQLSGGQQQRVAVARALAGSPSILLADEPTGNLDSKNGEAVMKLLQELHEEGATICMVTHDPRFAAHAQRQVHLFDGKVVAEGELLQLLADPAHNPSTTTIAAQ